MAAIRITPNKALLYFVIIASTARSKTFSPPLATSGQLATYGGSYSLPTVSPIHAHVTSTLASATSAFETSSQPTATNTAAVSACLGSPPCKTLFSQLEDCYAAADDPDASSQDNATQNNLFGECFCVPPLTSQNLTDCQGCQWNAGVSYITVMSLQTDILLLPVEPNALNANNPHPLLTRPVTSLLVGSTPAPTTPSMSLSTSLSQRIYQVGTVLLTVGGSDATVDGQIVSAAPAGIVSAGSTLILSKTILETGGPVLPSLDIPSTYVVTSTATTQLVTTAVITFAPGGAQNDTVTTILSDATSNKAGSSAEGFSLPTEHAPPPCGGRGPCSEGSFVSPSLALIAVLAVGLATLEA